MATPNLPNWQASILRGVGAPVTAQNLKFMNAWAQAEGGTAANNPFNTTQPFNQATNYNSVGVKNYQTPQAGIAATIQTLRNGHYGPILAAMANGGSAMADAQAEAQTPWGTGSLIEKVLGGRVTGGVPTPNGPPSVSLARSIQGGTLPLNSGGPPLQDLISYIMSNNNALTQQAKPLGYTPF